MSNVRKTWLITGASSGFGHAFATYALAQGHNVVATARSVSRLETFVAQAPDRVLAQKLDVERPGDAQAAVDATLARFGRIDVLINNTGYGIVGAVEETSEQELRAVMETNFFGAIAVTRAALPVLRAQRFGAIVNISSLGGQLSFPGFGPYSASKFALEGYSETLAMEVRAFNVHVTLVEPGDFRTGFTVKRRHVSLDAMDADYREPFEETITAVAQSEMDAPEPHRVAELVASILDDPAPKIRYPIGSPHRIAYVTRDLLAKAEVVKAAVPALKDREQRS